jgi:hypothetical protein
MSKSKVTPYELYNKIVDDVGDPGGLGIAVLRADEVNGFLRFEAGRRLCLGANSERRR